jgi:hypothetical protein
LLNLGSVEEKLYYFLVFFKWISKSIPAEIH